jgi:hypothetical protein
MAVKAATAMHSWCFPWMPVNAEALVLSRVPFARESSRGRCDPSHGGYRRRKWMWKALSFHGAFRRWESRMEAARRGSRLPGSFWH